MTKVKSVVEKPIKPAATNYDDVPIGGGKFATLEEAPVDVPLPRGTYNLDALGADAFGGDVVMSEPAKPKKAPPARFANKNATIAKEDKSGKDKQED
jgi:hypothetical protein